MTHVTPAICGFLAILACGTRPAVAQTGTLGFEGEWSGQMLNASGEVIASISFELERFRADTVHGPITILETGSDRPLVVDQWASQTEHEQRYDELHIDFVEAPGGGFVANVSRYRDSGCGCAMTTTLTGTVVGDRISGPYNAHHGGSGLDETGTWWVERR